MDKAPLYHLSGSDAFMLALESRGVHASAHDRFCYYILELSGHPETTLLNQELQKKLIWPINGLSLQNKQSFLRPHWKATGPQEIPVIELSDPGINSAEGFYSILTADQYLNLKHQVCFFRVKNDETSLLCMRWNHLLMDGLGATSLLQYLFNDLPLDSREIYPENPPIRFELWPFYKVIRLISNTSHKPIFFPELRKLNSPPNLATLVFSPSESIQVKKLAEECGAGIFPSIFFLAIFCQVIDQCRFWKGNSDFWVPVPVGTRRSGANTPIFGNHLSFYFFRIQRTLCKDLAANVANLREQMRYQSRKNYPRIYLMLTEFMRFLPLGFFYIFVKGWKRKQHASFMFTMAPNHPKSFNTVLGASVKRALNLPPNTDPPGLTFACMDHEGRLQIMIMCRENIVTADELDFIERTIRKTALGA